MKNLALAALILSLTTLVAFEPLRHNGFVSFDDPKYVTANKEVLAGISFKNSHWAFTTTHFYSWHPLTWLSHSLDCTLFGTNPLGHHAHSLLLHLLNTLLLFIILQELSKEKTLSLLLTAFWALHPLRVEAVAWVTGRKDMLVGLFFLLSLWSFLQYRKCGEKKWYGILALFFLCGLCSKPMIVTVPFLLLLCDWCYERELKSSIVQLAPLFVLTCLFSLLFYWTQASGGAMSPLAHLPFTAKVANSISSYGMYLWQTLYPLRLACLYPHRGVSYSPLLVLATLFFLIVVTLLLNLLRKKKQSIMFGWFWFLGTLVPVIGLVQLGTHARADRFTYIPAMGLSLLLVHLFQLLGEKSRKVGAAILLLFLLLSIQQTRFQTTTWRDSQTLYEHALQQTKKNYVIHNNLGTHLQAIGKSKEAEAQFRKAVQIHPHFAEAQTNLAEVLEKRGKTKEAISIYEKVAQQFPNYAPVFFKLGQLAKARNANGEACIHLKKAITLAPDLAPAHNDYGLALRALGRLDEAKQHFLIAVKLDEKLAAAWFNLAILAHVKGKAQEALVFYERAISADPNYVEAWANKAVALQSLQKMAEAEKAYERALQLDEENVDVIVNYAILLRGQQKYGPAAKQFRRALAIGGPNGEILAALKSTLAAQ